MTKSKTQIISAIKTANDARALLDSIYLLDSMSQRAYDILENERDLVAARGVVDYAAQCAEELENDRDWLMGLEPWVRGKVLGNCATIISRREAINFPLLNYYYSSERKAQR